MAQEPQCETHSPSPQLSSSVGAGRRDAIAQIRSFNRTVTERIGALQDEYLSRGRPLGASRLLWEIGDGKDVRVLRARLGLDSGYVSRLLRQLEGEGLVDVGASPEDRRVRFVSLTSKGRRERALLDRRSDDLAEAILGPLSSKQRERLVATMAEVERLLTASTVELREVRPSSPDAIMCLRAYFTELIGRSATGIDLEEAMPETGELDAGRGVFVLGYLRSEAVGCCGLALHEDGMAEVRRMWVSPRTRGLGLGRRLLEHIEGLARQRGVTTLRLDTNEHLVEAIAMYRSAGYVEIPRYTDEVFATHWFEKLLGEAGPSRAENP